MILKNEINQNSLQLIESSFEKKKLKPGILHIGVGNFHRSHQAYLIDKFIEKSSEFNWGIVGLNLISNSSNIIYNLKKRDGNYVLKTISSNGEVKYKNVKSIIELSDWSTEKENSEKILNNENIHLITITVTETGYFLNEKNELDENNKLIKDELNNKISNSIYAYLRIALNNRKKSTNKPITILCCDNLRENGKILKNCFIKYLELINDKELINWLSKNVTFPSCVVDRITPRTPENLAEEIEQNFNIKENCSVLSEDFIQWVIEEDFVAPFPALDQLDNVYFTTNVINFEETKIRVLNGGHSCLAYFGALKELNTFDQCFKEKFLDNFFKELENEEILPALGNMDPIKLPEYLNTIYSRFKNLYISDALERICMDGSSKFPIFVIPTIEKCFLKNIEPHRAISSIASWYIFMKKINNNEIKFNYIDPKWEWLKYFLHENKIDDFCTNTELWGDLPERFPRFKEILRLKIKDINFWNNLNG